MRAGFDILEIAAMSESHYNHVFELIKVGVIGNRDQYEERFKENAFDWYEGMFSELNEKAQEHMKSLIEIKNILYQQIKEGKGNKHELVNEVMDCLKVLNHYYLKSREGREMTGGNNAFGVSVDEVLDRVSNHSYQKLGLNDTVLHDLLVEEVDGVAKKYNEKVQQFNSVAVEISAPKKRSLLGKAFGWVKSTYKTIDDTLAEFIGFSPTKAGAYAGLGMIVVAVGSAAHAMSYSSTSPSPVVDASAYTIPAGHVLAVADAVQNMQVQVDDFALPGVTVEIEETAGNEGYVELVEEVRTKLVTYEEKEKQQIEALQQATVFESEPDPHVETVEHVTRSDAEIIEDLKEYRTIQNRINEGNPVQGDYNRRDELREDKDVNHYLYDMGYGKDVIMPERASLSIFYLEQMNRPVDEEQQPVQIAEEPVTQDSVSVEPEPVAETYEKTDTENITDDVAPEPSGITPEILEQQLVEITGAEVVKEPATPVAEGDWVQVMASKDYEEVTAKPGDSVWNFYKSYKDSIKVKGVEPNSLSDFLNWTGVNDKGDFVEGEYVILFKKMNSITGKDPLIVEGKTYLLPISLAVEVIPNYMEKLDEVVQAIDSFDPTTYTVEDIENGKLMQGYADLNGMLDRLDPSSEWGMAEVDYTEEYTQKLSDAYETLSKKGEVIDQVLSGELEQALEQDKKLEEEIKAKASGIAAPIVQESPVDPVAQDLDSLSDQELESEIEKAMEENSRADEELVQSTIDIMAGYSNRLSSTKIESTPDILVYEKALNEFTGFIDATLVVVKDDSLSAVLWGELDQYTNKYFIGVNGLIIENSKVFKEKLKISYEGEKAELVSYNLRTRKDVEDLRRDVNNLEQIAAVINPNIVTQKYVDQLKGSISIAKDLLDSESPRVILMDDYRMIRRGLKRLIASQPEKDGDKSKVDCKLTSPYGKRWGKFHAGVDVVWHKGGVNDSLGRNLRYTMEVRGKVTDVGYNKFRGNYVEIEVGDTGYKFEAFHLNDGSIEVKIGDIIRPGQLIAEIGCTGRVSAGGRGSNGKYIPEDAPLKVRKKGAHLHFGLIAPDDVWQGSKPNKGRVSPNHLGQFKDLLSQYAKVDYKPQ